MKGIAVKTPGGTVSCSQLVLATDTGPLFGLEKFFSRESSTIIASRPTGVRKIWPEEKILLTVDNKYDIIYPVEERQAAKHDVAGTVRQKGTLKLLHAISRWYS